MNEEMLRAMIREAVARRLGQAPEPPRRAGGRRARRRHDPSHDRYPLPPSGGPCLIEPTRCVQSLRLLRSHGH